jgi:hypothetical protein
VRHKLEQSNKPLAIRSQRALFGNGWTEFSPKAGSTVNGTAITLSSSQQIAGVGRQLWLIRAFDVLVMFTLFHLLALVGLSCGAALGGSAGWGMFGVVGAVVGSIAGAVAGFAVGHIPLLIVGRSLAKDLGKKTSDELRAHLHSRECLTPNCVLLELRRRGEDIQRELPVVLDLLVSEEVGKRSLGLAALTSAFPELAERLRDYRIGDSVEECRRKTEVLRQTSG